MSKRKAISKSKRFEILQRDRFRCQYCGASANETTLEVDHIVPVSKGGSDDDSNLITACWECNSGKSATELDDDTVRIMRLSQLKSKFVCNLDQWVDVDMFRMMSSMMDEFGFEAVADAIDSVGAYAPSPDLKDLVWMLEMVRVLLIDRTENGAR